MTGRGWRRFALVASPLMVLTLAACGSDGGPAKALPGALAGGLAAADRAIKVHRSPTCGCCHEYEGYLEDQGFQVDDMLHDDVMPIKESLGVPTEEQSCHTSEIAGYFVEGHVPAEAILDLLKTRPAIDGIALAGMPQGSPGMNGAKEGPFVVDEIVDGEVVGELGRY